VSALELDQPLVTLLDLQSTLAILWVDLHQPMVLLHQDLEHLHLAPSEDILPTLVTLLLVVILLTLVTLPLDIKPYF